MMQIVALIFGQPDFNSLTIDISDTPIFYGRVITATVSFILVALAVFGVVNVYNAMRKDEEADAPDELQLLTRSATHRSLAAVSADSASVAAAQAGGC